MRIFNTVKSGTQEGKEESHKIPSAPKHRTPGIQLGTERNGTTEREGESSSYKAPCSEKMRGQSKRVPKG